MSAMLELRDVGKVVMRGQRFWWQKLRELGKGAEFTVKDIDLAGNDRIDNVRDFVRRLEAAGIVECVQRSATRDRDHRYQKSRYRLVRAPRTLPPLTRSGAEGVQGRRNENMWAHMRMVNTFTKRTLADFASIEGLKISVETAASYIKHLKAAGYLITVSEGHPRKPAVYRLDPTKNTGPNPPMILRSNMVYDQNTELLAEPIVAQAVQ